MVANPALPSPPCTMLPCSSATRRGQPESSFIPSPTLGSTPRETTPGGSRHPPPTRRMPTARSYRDPIEALDDGVLVGLHVEKGVGPTAAPIFEEGRFGQSLVMHRDWRWTAFLRGIDSGAVDEDLRAAREAAGELPLRVLVVTSTASLPKMESGDWRGDWPVERVMYDVQAPGLKRWPGGSRPAAEVRRGRDTGLAGSQGCRCP